MENKNKESMNELITQEWYEELVKECKAIITEAVFTSRWALVEGYWGLGKRIREEKLVKEHIKGNKTFVQGLAISLGISTTTLYYALQAYDKFPNLDKIPEGKNISWNKLKTLYLPSMPVDETPALPKGKYSVIYADPPWWYGDKQDTSMLGGAQKHYPSMKIESLCAMGIEKISADNAVLFLWVTSPLLDECWSVITSWGFEYKTSFVWDKVKHNMGHYNSVRHELLLVCTRGSYVPQINKLFDSVISIERSEKHSEKPKEFRTIIETLYPKSKKIELFSRQKVDGWDAYGNEV